ncbi:X-linked retinitis pigmentosa GTPase regulator isoform X2 [Anabrus simplex]|uniref:X-linked retinitis pigmentosa GTPase regulator isoform X2 n=1 Tax=Anabrus simplex TaxID=316456 RepID=UPI0034DD7A21
MAGDEEIDIPGTGAVFTFGRSRFAENVPSHFFIRNDPIVELACGDEHTALVCEKGRVFVFGNNDYGQLGLGHRNIMTRPSCVKTLKPEKIIHIACGKAHTLAATESGKLFTWGSNSDGQLGVGDVQDRALPTHVLDYEGGNIRQLSAGCLHSATLTENGCVYVWGANSDGQLGLNDGADNVLIPKELPFNKPIIHISCGYYHTAFVTVDGDLYVCGEGESGKLGLPNSVSNCTSPTRVITESPVISVSCGGNHTLAVTEGGKVYAFGNNFSGQLGLGADIPQSILPTVVTELIGHVIMDVICGENHSAFVTDKGQLYMCGEGRYGKLCNEDIDATKQSLPVKVPKFRNFIVKRVACGGCHTMVLANFMMENEGELEPVSLAYEGDPVSGFAGHSQLPPIVSPTSLNNNNSTNLTEDEDRMSTIVEHNSVHSKEDLMDSIDSVDMNGNEESEEDVDDTGDSAVTKEIEDIPEKQQSSLHLEDVIEKDDSLVDEEGDNDDVTVEPEEKKESRVARFFSTFRRKKPNSAQSAGSINSKTEEQQQRSPSIGQAQLRNEIGSGDACTRATRGNSGKSNKSLSGAQKKSRACTVL